MLVQCTKLRIIHALFLYLKYKYYYNNFPFSFSNKMISKISYLNIINIHPIKLVFFKNKVILPIITIEDRNPNFNKKKNPSIKSLISTNLYTLIIIAASKTHSLFLYCCVQVSSQVLRTACVHIWTR